MSLKTITTTIIKKPTQSTIQQTITLTKIQQTDNHINQNEINNMHIYDLKNNTFIQSLFNQIEVL